MPSHPSHPTQSDFDEARAFIWTTARRQRLRLDAIGTSHLVNLRRHLRRRREQLQALHEDFLMSQLDPKMSAGFSGLEDAVEFTEEALRFVLIETKRRLIEAADAEEAQMLAHLDPSDVDPA